MMLMDLGRNDVGRVAKIGSVQVTENMVVERYSHVMHIVSNVEGKLKPGSTRCRCCARPSPPARSPARPRSGPWRSSTSWSRRKRGIYAGAVGYLGFNGDMDLADRDPHRRGQGRNGCTCRLAPGSWPTPVPASEWTETQNKARAVLRAAEMAQAGLNASAAAGGLTCC